METRKKANLIFEKNLMAEISRLGWIFSRSCPSAADNLFDGIQKTLEVQYCNMSCERRPDRFAVKRSEP